MSEGGYNFAMNLSQVNLARLFVAVGRVLLALAFLALLGAWLTQVTGAPIFGMNQQHFFGDATALALIGIGCLLDTLLHSKGQ